MLLQFRGVGLLDSGLLCSGCRGGFSLIRSVCASQGRSVVVVGCGRSQMFGYIGYPQLEGHYGRICGLSTTAEY